VLANTAQGYKPIGILSHKEGPVGRGTSIGAVLIVIWLIIGAIAAGQRGYFDGTTDNCAEAGTIIVTVIAGPLNYIGVNPKIDCTAPQPSP
jgi:hypothetical protein